MSSFTRRLQRKPLRVAKTYAGKSQHVITLDNGGYCVCRPTRGYLMVSSSRLRAQGMLREMAEAIIRRGGVPAFRIA
jgi:hypothetical protein